MFGLQGLREICGNSIADNEFTEKFIDDFGMGRNCPIVMIYKNTENLVYKSIKMPQRALLLNCSVQKIMQKIFFCHAL